MIVYVVNESLSGGLNRQSGFTGGSRNKMSDLQLYIPHPEDGWFYVKMMSDPETMAYNAPWFPPDGCIPEPEAEWLDLQADWIGKAPERFYAFLQRKSDGAFVGDVNYHSSPEQDWCDMGIVIYAPERGKGYGRQGLSLCWSVRSKRTAWPACTMISKPPATPRTASTKRSASGMPEPWTGSFTWS